MNKYLSYVAGLFFLGLFHTLIPAQLPPWTAGRLDRSFGTDGILEVPNSGGSVAGGETVFLPDGSMLTVNTYLNNVPASIKVLKLTPAGLPDKSFGTGGHVTISFDHDSNASGVVQLPNGKSLVAGTVWSGSLQRRNDWVVIRLNPDGSVDQTFGEKGVFRKDFSEQEGEISEDVAGGLLLEADGKIVVSGTTDRLVTDQLYSTSATLIRLTPEGTIDPTFGKSGVSRIQIGTNRVNVRYGLRGGRLYRTPGGSYMVGVHAERELSSGDFVPQAFLLRFEQGGSIDKTFGKAGILDLAPSSSSEFADLVFDPAGRIIVSIYMRISRYLPDGQLDQSFGNNGHYLASSSNFFNFDLEIASNGKLLVTGAETVPLIPSGVRTFGQLLRLNSNGTPDLRFGRSGFAFLSNDEFDVSFVASRIRNDLIYTQVFQSENHFGFFGVARHYFAK